MRFNGLEALVLSDGTTMENARIAKSLARTGLQQVQARMSPTIALTATKGTSDQLRGELSGDGGPRTSSLVLNFNLFNGGATRRGIQQRSCRFSSAEQSLANQEQGVLRILPIPIALADGNGARTPCRAVERQRHRERCDCRTTHKAVP